jgi:outer membrane protein assembly factor BamB
MSMFTSRQKLLLHSSSVLLLLAACVAAGEPVKNGKPADAGWPQFLGPDRNGISRETGLLTAWPDDGPREVWRVPGGVGMSAMAIRGGRLYTMVQKSDRQWVVCLDAKTGKAEWEKDLAPAYKNQMGDGPRATPAIAGDMLYVFTGEGVLAALNTADGKVVWQHNVVSEFDGKPTDYGMACSPLVLGDRVIITTGAPDATVVALERKSGAVAWTAGKDIPPGYSSPAVLKVAGEEQLVVFHGSGTFGLDPATGAERWSHSYETDFNCNIVTPLAIDGKVFLSSGENHGSVLLALKARSDKKFDVEEVWTSQGPKSVLRNEWQTSILLDGYLYGFDNVGSAGPVTHLTCVNAATGARQWQQVRFGKGNLIAADGKLFLSTMQGELVVVTATPRGYEELGRKTVIGKTRQAPALANGLLYLRDDREIVCLDVRQK